MQLTGVVLTLGFYLSMLILFGNYAAKAFIWTKSKPLNEKVFRKPSVKALVMAVCDILSFRRLLIANECLWIGEWIFHMSFILVMLRHLRYFLNPVPQWVWGAQQFGIIAGYVLPVSLVYILTVKFLIEKKNYVSSYNFLLLILILALGVSGLLMKTIFHPDIVAVKTFTMGIATFSFAAARTSALFIFHFFLFLALIVNLPTHIFAAPLSLISARERDENLNQVIHEEQGLLYRKSHGAAAH